MGQIHRDCWVSWVSDVFCFGNFWRYIGNSLYWPIPMYILDRFEPPYIGMGIEISIPMYRLLKLVQYYIGKALNQAFPMYVPKTIHPRYIGIQQKYQIPMYFEFRYIGIPIFSNFRCILTCTSLIISREEVFGSRRIPPRES